MNDNRNPAGGYLISSFLSFFLKKKKNSSEGARSSIADDPMEAGLQS